MPTPSDSALSSIRSVYELPTPALVVERSALDHNLDVMSAALPGARLRPHVKAHKCTALAKAQHARGHRGFTCATTREMEGMAAAGLGEDLLLANEVVDPRRLGALAALAERGARITVAVDSAETVRAAAAAGLREVLVDVNVGLPRCGCAPEAAPRIADAARSAGLEVRGVMGYEGHAVGIADRAQREAACEASMQKLVAAHARVGGEVVSAGGTGTYDCNHAATEIQAGSYALMDTAYDELGMPFRQALWIVSTVVSVSEGYAVADCGLKSLGMDHGKPSIDGASVWFCSDEHVTFAPSSAAGSAAGSAPGLDAGKTPRVGDRIRVTPAHVDPTVAYHERLYVVEGETVLEHWQIDLRGW